MLIVRVVLGEVLDNFQTPLPFDYLSALSIFTISSEISLIIGTITLLHYYQFAYVW